MRISEAKFDGVCLKLYVSSKDALRFVFNFKPGEYEIVKSKKKRSLDANAYCWALCTEIAKALSMTKEEVYIREISEGNEYEALIIDADKVDSFTRIWQSKGIGWTVDVVDDAPNGKELIFAYYGSSAYDTKQMAQLLDRLIQDAEALGIPTITDAELDNMKGAWNVR